MPQLLSRMDDLGWLTPSIADILDQGAAPPGGDGTIREQMLALQQKLSELETPARIANVRATPSYTMFVTRPDTVGRLGSRRPVTPNEIRRSLGQIADERKEWKLGFLPQVPDSPDAVGILLRTDDHKPLSLRRMLVRNTFRDHPSTLAFALGNTLDQRLIVRDLAEIGNLAVIGVDAAKQHLIMSILLTLASMNTPGELRIAAAGENSEAYKVLLTTPHALGRVLTTPQDGQRLIDGLLKELERRQHSFAEEKVEALNDFNVRLHEKGKTILPRILLVIDSLSNPNWQEARDAWIPAITTLLADGGKAGIHLIVAADEMQAPDIPGAIAPLFPVYVATRSAGNAYAEKLKNFHNSLMRFVDAFIIDGSEEDITPIEICVVSNEEIQNAVIYWRQASAQRVQEAKVPQVSGKTGVTGMLEPPPEAGARSAAQPESTAQAAAPVAASAKPPRVSAAEISFEQAQALAAYLGWIGVGPLQDILGMSVEEAQKTLIALRTMGIVEDTAAPTPRFIRVISEAARK